MKTRWKVLIGVGLFVLLLVFAGSWYLSKYWKPIVNDRLQSLVASSTDSLYRLTYDDFDFSWHTGNAFLTNVKLQADSQVYERLKLENRAPDNRYNIAIKAIKIRNFHPQRLYQSRKLNIDELLIESASISVVSEDVFQDTMQARANKSPYEQISGILNEIRVNSLNIVKLSYAFENRSDSNARRTSLRHINIAVNDVLIDSLSQQDSSRLYYSQGIHFRMDEYQMATADSLYHLHLNGISFSTAERALHVGRIALKPRKSKKDHGDSGAAERIDLAFDSLSLEEIDIRQLLESQRFHAGSLRISKGYVEVFRDAGSSKAKKRIGQRALKDPHDHLKDFARNIRIETVELARVDVAYEELSKITRLPGRITFNQSRLRLRNVTNDSAMIRKNRFLQVDVDSRFMNSAALEANFMFDMLSPQGEFQYRGKLGSFNGKRLNSVLRPLAQVEIGSAAIRSLAFNFKGNKRRTVGAVDFRYHSMKINMLKLEDGRLSNDKLVSNLANNFILNPSNPDAEGQFIKANVRMARPQDYSFFKIVWRSIFQGIKTSAGVNEEREAQLKRTASDAKNVVNKTKKTAKQVGTFFKEVFNKKEKKNE